MNYYEALLSGRFGRIKSIHRELAKIVKTRPELSSRKKIKFFASKYKKYKKLTYREYDLVLALTNKKLCYVNTSKQYNKLSD